MNGVNEPPPARGYDPPYYPRVLPPTNILLQHILPLVLLTVILTPQNMHPPRCFAPILLIWPLDYPDSTPFQRP